MNPADPTFWGVGALAALFLFVCSVAGLIIYRVSLIMFRLWRAYIRTRRARALVARTLAEGRN